MALKFTRKPSDYISETAYAYDVAQTSKYFDKSVYESLAASGDDEAIQQYVFGVAGARDKQLPDFSEHDYKYLSNEDKASYTLTLLYTDPSSDEYKQAMTYFDTKVQEGIDKETYNSLNAFQKTIASIGGIVGNALNETLFGTIEGLVDLGTLAVGGVSELVTGGKTDLGAKEAIQKDFTGVASNREALQRFSRAYSYLDKNKFMSIANDVVTGLSQMAPMVIPVVGPTIYFGAMAGNTAANAVAVNPDIDYLSLIGYTAAVTGIEFATEKLSAGIFGGTGNFIDSKLFGTQSTKALTKVGEKAAQSWVYRLGLNFVSEGLEESIAEFADTALFNVFIAQGNDELRKSYSVEDILYAGLIGGLIGGLMEGGSLAATTKLSLTESGELITTADAKAQNIKTKKDFSKIQTKSVQELLSQAKMLIEQDAVLDLLAKYPDIKSRESLSIKHPEEYKKAVAKNKQIRSDAIGVAMGLVKVFEMAGTAGFNKAVELVNGTFEQRQSLLQTYLDVVEARGRKDLLAIDDKINKALAKEYGSEVVFYRTRTGLTPAQIRLANNMKNRYGIDVYYGTFGSSDGNNRKFDLITEETRFGATISANEIVLDTKQFGDLSEQEILNKVIKEELVHTIQFTKDVITPKTLYEIYKATGNLDIAPKQLNPAYEGESQITKVSEAQAKAIAEVLLFDDLTVDKMFKTNYSTFNKLYLKFNEIRNYIENSKQLRSQKGKMKYNQLLKSMKMYRDAAAKQLGTAENVEKFIDQYEITKPEQQKELRDAYIENASVEPIEKWTEAVFSKKKKEPKLSKEAYDALYNEDGTPKTFYKGAGVKGIKEFNTLAGEKRRTTDNVAWVSDKIEVSKSYSSEKNKDATIYSLDLTKINNPKVIDAKNAYWNNIDGKTTDQLAAEAIAENKGYDAIIIKNVIDVGTHSTDRALLKPATSIGIIDPSKIKIIKETPRNETTQLKLAETEQLEKQAKKKSAKLPEIKFDKSELIDNEQITLGEYLASKTGNDSYEKPITATEVVEKMSNTITFTDSKNRSASAKIAQAIENVIDTGIRKISQQQLTTSTKLEYQALDVRMIADPVFASVTEDNFFDVFGELSSNPTARTLLKNAMDLRIGADTDGRFSEAFKEKYADWSRQETTSAAQDIGLKAALLRDTKPVTSFVKDLTEKGYELTIDDSILSEFDERFKQKDKYIAELESEVSALEKQIEDNKNNNIEQQALIDDYLDKINELKTMKNGSVADILDWLINNVDDLNETAKLTSSVLNRLLDASRKAEEQGKEVGIYLKGKEVDKPFPKTREFVYKWLKKLRSFRLWAMTSSPISWVRNWVGNKGMQILDNATNAVERGIFKAYNANKKTSDWIPTDSVKFNESKAGKDVYSYIDKQYGEYILAEIRGQNKYLDSEDTSDAKKAQFARLIRQKEKAEATGFNKVVQTVRGWSDWGLSTGFFGDDIRIYKSICKNLGNLVASSHEYLLNTIRQEYTTLSKLYEQKGGKLDAKQLERYDLLSKALKTKTDTDILNATNKTEMKRLITECANKSFDQYFRTSNGFSKWCNNLAQKNPIAAELISWVVPFPKVAINILKMGYRYSPLGFIRGLYQQFGLTKNAKLSPQEIGTIRAEAIRSYSEASVGTLMLLAGAIAAALGWVDVDDDDYLGPALNLGDIRVGLSDLAPSMTTFSVASSFVYGWKENKEPFKLALNTIYDNTLLSNIENVFRYSTPEQYVENLSISYFASYIPAVVKLVNKWTTNNTYKDKTGSYWNKVIKTMGSYIPGLSTLIPNKINPYTGQVATGTGSLSAWFNVLASLSPVQLEKTERNALGNEAFRLGTGTTGLSGKFTINDKDYVLKDKEKEKYAKYRAEYISNSYDRIVAGKEQITIKDEKTNKYKTVKYSQLTDEEKKKVLSNIYSKGTSTTKIKYWIDSGNKYVVTDRDTYYEYKKLFGNSANIVYKKSWSTSKFVEG